MIGFDHFEPSRTALPPAPSAAAGRPAPADEVAGLPKGRSGVDSRSCVWQVVQPPLLVRQLEKQRIGVPPCYNAGAGSGVVAGRPTPSDSGHDADGHRDGPALCASSRVPPVSRFVGVVDSRLTAAVFEGMRKLTTMSHAPLPDSHVDADTPAWWRPCRSTRRSWRGSWRVTSPTSG